MKSHCYRNIENCLDTLLVAWEMRLISAHWKWCVMCSNVPCNLLKMICSAAVWRFMISRCDVGWNVAQSLSNWNWWSDPKFLWLQWTNCWQRSLTDWPASSIQSTDLKLSEKMSGSKTTNYVIAIIKSHWIPYILCPFKRFTESNTGCKVFLCCAIQFIT